MHRKAGRPPLVEGEKARRIALSLNEGLHEYLKRLAKANRTSVSELIRRAVIGASGKTPMLASGMRASHRGA